MAGRNIFRGMYVLWLASKRSEKPSHPKPSHPKIHWEQNVGEPANLSRERKSEDTRTESYMLCLEIHSLRLGWRNLVPVSLIFVIIVSFMLSTVF